MADHSCIYCEDRGNCTRCSYFFEPEVIHKACGKKWKDHEVHTQPDYPPWVTC